MKRSITFILLLLVVSACCRLAQTQSVDAIWSARERELLRASKEWKQDDLLKAGSFFEITTGIKSHLAVNYLGVVPTNIDESLMEWRSWYKTNRPLLYVNPSTGSIEKK